MYPFRNHTGISVFPSLFLISAFLVLAFCPRVVRADLVRTEWLSLSGYCSTINGQALGNKMAMGDLNGDGFADLVVRSEDDILFYYGLASGGVMYRGTFEHNDSIQNFAVADFNQDGYADWALVTRYRVQVYLGGAGTQPLPPDPPSTSPDFEHVFDETIPLSAPVLARDVNGDGVPDFLYNGTSGSHVLFSHVGAPDFEGPFPLSRGEMDRCLAECGDVNGDGWTDWAYPRASDFGTYPVVRAGAADQAAWAWGNNLYGELGQGDTTSRFSPTPVGSNLDWAAMALGAGHTLAIRRDGTLWAWGSNSGGQLGDGTTTDRHTPVQIIGASNWVAVAAGGGASYALNDDGALYSWGNNGFGQLGDGTFTDRSTPTLVGSYGQWQAMGAGSRHALGIKKDGTLWAWGNNEYGQVGDGTIENRNTPRPIGTATDWRSVDGGAYCSVALRWDGTAWAWGLNGYGELGDGTYTDRHQPQQVGADTDWVYLDAGFNSHYCLAGKSDQHLYAWGTAPGVVQTNTPSSFHTAEDWLQVSAGYAHVLAIKEDGTLWARGDNYYGQLGLGDTTDRSQFEQVGSDQDWLLAVAGMVHSSAVRDDQLALWEVQPVAGVTSTFFGNQVTGTGDLNGDGYDDFAMHDYGFDGGDPGGPGYWGRTYFWYGGPAAAGDPVGLGLDHSALSADMMIDGSIENAGTRSWAFGDINDDGLGDAVLSDPMASAWCDDGSGEITFTASGAVYVYRSSTPLNNSISGTVWHDYDNDGSIDPGDEMLAGILVYADYNQDDVHQTGEPYDLSDAQGAYTVSGIDPGWIRFRCELPTGWRHTFPETWFYDLQVYNEQDLTGYDFGIRVSPPPLFTCELDWRTANLSWFQVAHFDSLHLSRGGQPLATLPGDSDSYVDAELPDGVHVWNLTGFVGGFESRPSACSGTAPNLLPVENLEALVSYRHVELTWTNAALYDSLLVTANGADVAWVPGSVEVFNQEDLPSGEYEFAVVARREEVLAEAVTCQVSIRGWQEVNPDFLQNTSFGQAVSLVDLDSDGLAEVYLLREPLANVLARNEGEMVFTQVLTGILQSQCRDICWADADKDGLLEGFVADQDDQSSLWHAGYVGDELVLQDVTPPALAAITGAVSATWVDYNLDAAADLFVSTANGDHLLFQNQGDLQFTSVFSGVFSGHAYGAGTTWADMDNDGDQDCFIAGDRWGSNNLLFRNDVTGFVDKTPPVMDMDRCQTGAWGDYDNDGDLDLFVTRTDLPNHLFRNDGGGVFVDATPSVMLSESGRSTGAVWGDFDNDGRLDLFVGNDGGQANEMYRNDPVDGFLRVEDTVLDLPGTTRGVACADLDRDGDLDLAVAEEYTDSRLLENVLDNHNRWLLIRLEGGEESNPRAIGARVEVHAGGRRLIREVSGGGGLGGQNALELHFGLGYVARADSVVVYWPSGLREVKDFGIGANRHLVLTEGKLAISAVSEEVPAAYHLDRAVPNPFNPMTTVHFSLPQDARVWLTVYDGAGRRVRRLLNGELRQQGHQEATWQGRDDNGRTMAAGVYFCEMKAADYRASIKMTLVR